MDQEISSRSPFLRTLADDSASALLAAAEPVQVARGRVIFSEGEFANGFYFVIAGKVKLSRREGTEPQNGAQRESLLRLLTAGSMLGELSALDDGVRSSTATAVTRCDLAHIPQHRLSQVMRDFPELTTGFLRHFASRLRWADLVLSELALNGVSGRVAATLLYLSESIGTVEPTGIAVKHDLTQAELASMVGATRETVNRTLTELAAKGVISNGVRKVTILDSDRLRDLVH